MKGNIGVRLISKFLFKDSLKVMIKWPLYGLAVAVAAQRVNDNRHWLSDVVAGALVGEAVGGEIYRFHYHRNVEGAVVPYISPDGMGLQIGRFDGRRRAGAFAHRADVRGDAALCRRGFDGGRREGVKP